MSASDPEPGPAGNEGEDTGQARATRLTQAFVAAIPHAGELGLACEAAAPGQVTLSMPWDGRLVGDPSSGVIHGGPVFTLMDSAAGAAVLSHPQSGGGPTATLSLRIDYMRAATPGQTIRARAECHHVTRNVAFVRAVAQDDDATRPVAIATGTFTLGATGRAESRPDREER
ncbi:MAG: PaaI family thioesterase [Rubellimicrobium sp.]|nr:PaaI family thioesterase [Rubellimicrobium sp.]